MPKPRVLFVCIHNSARSVTGAALLNSLCGDKYSVESAGLEPGKLNPLAVEALKDKGIDVSDYQPRAVAEVIRADQQFDIVITVCDIASAERCPMISGKGERLHWSFPDPSVLAGSWEEKVAVTREIKNRIKERIESEFCAQRCA